MSSRVTRLKSQKFQDNIAAKRGQVLTTEPAEVCFVQVRLTSYIICDSFSLLHRFCSTEERSRVHCQPLLAWFHFLCPRWLFSLRAFEECRREEIRLLQNIAHVTRSSTLFETFLSLERGRNLKKIKIALNIFQPVRRMRFIKRSFKKYIEQS